MSVTAGSIAKLLQGLTPFFSPALLLVLGMLLSALGLIRSPSLRSQLKTRGSQILQWSIVLLGFKIPLAELIATSASGILTTAVSVTLVLGMGWLLAKWIPIEQDQAVLISTGTAICGGSAIAAVSGSIKPRSVDMGVALAIVFILNALALVTFPPVGHILHLSDVQFANWAALAIHDTSSVVGASAQWGEHALQLATTIKLSRTLWIFPIVLGLSWFRGRKKKMTSNAVATTRPAFPLFILGFVLASALRSFDSPLKTGILGLVPILTPLSVIGFGASLGLIGLSISREQIKSLTVRPVVYGVLLWLITAGVSLGYVSWGLV